MALRVLVVDDDKKLFELLGTFLEQNGIHAEHAPDGAVALTMLSRSSVDAVVLDVMMPHMDGLEVLSRIRKTSRVPVLMLTAKGDETDRVVGLELGADDYLAKPFSPRELMARIRAVMRRVQPDAAEERLVVSGVSADLGTRSVELDGRRVDVTGLEFDLLVALMRRAGRVVPRSRLLAEAGRDDVTVNERAVDVHISHIRKKLGDERQQLIRTVRGVGYVFSRESP